MRDAAIFLLGYSAFPFTRWLRKRPWFDRLTTAMARRIDRATGYRS